MCTATHARSLKPKGTHLRHFKPKGARSRHVKRWVREVYAEDAIAELRQTLSVKGNRVSSLRPEGRARAACGELLVR